MKIHNVYPVMNLRQRLFLFFDRNTLWYHEIPMGKANLNANRQRKDKIDDIM
jgi:hypothetical protein